MGAADETAIRAALDVLFEPGQVVEMRVPNMDGKKSRTDSGYFDDFDKLAKAAARASGHADGIYVTLNVVEPSLLARYENRIEQWAPYSTGDDHIERRRWLLVDCDPKVRGKKRATGISSTDEEHEAALAKARAIRAWLSLQSWTDPVLCDSGNGAALLYVIELPNDQASTDLIKRVLEALAERFDDIDVDIDTSVFNASRITKLPGTLAGKGDSTATRPHRLAKLLDVPSTRIPVATDLLEAVAKPRAAETTARSNGHVSSVFDGTAWIEDWLKKHGLAYTKGKHGTKTKIVLNAGCVFNSDHTGKDAAIIVHPGGKLGYHCFHNSCQVKQWHDVREKFDGPLLVHDPTRL